MRGRRYPLVAREGIPILLLAIVITGLCSYYEIWIVAIPAAILSVALYFLFRDPYRLVPAHPLAAVSPVDGVVAEVTVTNDSVNGSPAHKIIIRVDVRGTYTARSPVEGSVLDPARSTRGADRTAGHPGLWIRTDEGDDVLLRFFGYRFGLVPRAFPRYGERVGQGQRCAYLRLTRFAEVHLPLNSQIQVTSGQRLRAGTDMLGTLPHP